MILSLEREYLIISNLHELSTASDDHHIIAQLTSNNSLLHRFNTSRIEELMNLVGVLPNMFILSPDEMSLSSDGETLLINVDTSLTNWTTTLLGWNARFKVLSGKYWKMHDSCLVFPLQLVRKTGRRSLGAIAREFIEKDKERVDV